MPARLVALQIASPVAPETLATVSQVPPVPEASGGTVLQTPDAPTLQTAPPADTVVPDQMPSLANENAATDQVDRLKITAARVSYAGTLVMAQGAVGAPVEFTARGILIRAQKLSFDSAAQVVKASGDVFMAREIQVVRRELRAARSQTLIEREELFTSTARGQNLTYNFKTQNGSLDSAGLVLPAFHVEAASIEINGTTYSAKNVMLRPGGLSDAELKIYGTPPFSLRARRATFQSSQQPDQSRVRVSGAALYFRSTKLFPLPSTLFRLGSTSSAQPGQNRVTPRFSTNSADRILLKSEFVFPLDKTNLERFDLLADLGYSFRVGFRGGASLQSRQSFGRFALGYRISDVISTQLTNRIELDRQPEFSFVSNPFLVTTLPGKRRGGFAVELGAGDYTERSLGSGERVSARRLLARVNYSTRLTRREGPFLNLFASRSIYSSPGTTYDSQGLQIGYEGPIMRNVRGQLSLLQTSLSGDTPFRFDRVEIASEARVTLDIELSPRWIVPLDVRYDLKEGRLRDETFGLLRSYKNFAYGLVYQSARRDLRLELRSAF